MKQNKSLIRFLVLLVLGVWGLVAYQVYGSIGSHEDEDAGAPSSVDPGTAANRAPYVYSADVRDPFHFGRSEPPDSLHRRIGQVPKEVWLPPPLKLTGVLLNKGKKKTAVLEAANGSVFFLSEGDTLAGAKILKVDRSDVTYLFRKKKSQWTLEAAQ